MQDSASDGVARDSGAVHVRDHLLLDYKVTAPDRLVVRSHQQ